MYLPYTASTQLNTYVSKLELQLCPNKRWRSPADCTATPPASMLLFNKLALPCSVFYLGVDVEEANVSLQRSKLRSQEESPPIN